MNLQIAAADGPAVHELGNRRELFVDRRQVERTEGVELVLHPPQQVETVFRFDAPWEGLYAAYVTVFADGDLFRMYYRGWATDKSPQLVCYAESRDGRSWTRPELGLFDFQGSKQNNIIWAGEGKQGTHNFAPFLDTRPGVPAEERYKALGGSPLYAFASADGVHWRQLAEAPVMTKGAFDSQNLAFWDPRLNSYVAYYRIFTNKVRAVARATSSDFRTWSDPTPIVVHQPQPEHFYTNATLPYFRAAEYYFSFPKRFVPSRQKLPDHPTRGISDAVFLSSRDGLNFDRTFTGALIRPGLDQGNWGDRSNMPAWGLVPVGDSQMALYYSQNYRFPTHHLNRGVWRLDGLASARAGAEGGMLLTKPLKFDGQQLRLNYATSAAGSVRVEILDESEKPLSGFDLEAAPELYGDALDEAYAWKKGSDLASLTGKVVRLRFHLREADLYAYRFGE